MPPPRGPRGSPRSSGMTPHQRYERTRGPPVPRMDPARFSADPTHSVPIRPIRSILTRAHEPSLARERASERASGPDRSGEPSGTAENNRRWGLIQESTWTPSPSKVIHLTVIVASRIFLLFFFFCRFFFRYPVGPKHTFPFSFFFPRRCPSWRTNIGALPNRRVELFFILTTVKHAPVTFEGRVDET